MIDDISVTLAPDQTVTPMNCSESAHPKFQKCLHTNSIDSNSLLDFHFCFHVNFYIILCVFFIGFSSYFKGYFLPERYLEIRLEGPFNDAFKQDNKGGNRSDTKKPHCFYVQIKIKTHESDN